MILSSSKDLGRQIQDNINAIGAAIIDLDPDIVCPLPRRATRILDHFMSEKIAAKINGRIIYPTALHFNPELFRGKRVAVIDDNVQRGISLLTAKNNLSEQGTVLSYFAISKCNWHEEHDQYSGIKISEPCLRCTGREFELVTSYINLSLWESPIPLNYEDTTIRIQFDNHVNSVTIAQLLAEIGSVGRIPSHHAINIDRISCFLGEYSQFSAGFESQAPVRKESETKICFHIGADGETYLVPLVLFDVKANFSEQLGNIPEFATQFYHVLSASSSVRGNSGRLLFEAVHLAAEATLAGRIWRFLIDRGLGCLLEVREHEFSRYYGTIIGPALSQLFTQKMKESRQDFESPKITEVVDLKYIDTTSYNEMSTEVRDILAERYEQDNSSKQSRIQWTPSGLTFEELSQEISRRGIAVSRELLSLVLDGQLSSSWLRTDCRPLVLQFDGSLDAWLRTEYQRTEQMLGPLSAMLSPDLASIDRGGSRPKDEMSFRRVSFARGSEEIIKFRTISTLKLALQSLKRVVASEKVPLGHLEHLLRVYYEMDIALDKMTYFVPNTQPHGRVIAVGPGFDLLTKPTPIEALQVAFGISISEEKGFRYVLADTALERDEDFLDSIRATNTGIEFVLQKCADSLGILSLNRALIYLSSCRRRKDSLDAILFDLKGVAEGLRSSKEKNKLSGTSRTSCDSFVGGCKDKLAILKDSGLICNFFRSIELPGDLKNAVRTFIDDCKEDQSSVFLLAIFAQSVAEASTFLRLSQDIPHTMSLFEQTPAKEGPLDALLFWEWVEDYVEQAKGLSNLVSAYWHYDEPDFRAKTAKLSDLRRRECNGKTFADVVFIKVDAMGHQGEHTESTALRDSHDFPLLRLIALYYGGFQAKHEYEGDAIYFAFGSKLKAARFLSAVIGLLVWSSAIPRRYRIAACNGSASFDNNNINSVAMNYLASLESGFLRNEEKKIEGARFSIVVSESMLTVPASYAFEACLKYLGIALVNKTDYTVKAGDTLSVRFLILT